MPAKAATVAGSRRQRIVAELQGAGPTRPTDGASKARTAPTRQFSSAARDEANPLVTASPPPQGGTPRRIRDVWETSLRKSSIQVA